MLSRMPFSNERNASRPGPASLAAPSLVRPGSEPNAEPVAGAAVPIGSCTSIALTFTPQRKASRLPSRRAPSHTLTAFAPLQNWHPSRSGTFLSLHTRSITNSSSTRRIEMSQFRNRPFNCFYPRGGDTLMDPLTSAAASGIRSRIESLDMLANNIANSSAPGFKADREFYSLYLSAEAAESPAGTTPETLPVIQRQWTDFRQGVLTPTSNPLDLALDGQGFLVADSPSGPIYTRNGSLRLSPDGQLETMDGYAIQSQDGKPIQLDSSKSVEITPDGMVRQDGQDVGTSRGSRFQRFGRAHQTRQQLFPGGSSESGARSRQRHSHPAGSARSRQFSAGRIRRALGQRDAPVRKSAEGADHRAPTWTVARSRKSPRSPVDEARTDDANRFQQERKT